MSLIVRYKWLRVEGNRICDGDTTSRAVYGHISYLNSGWGFDTEEEALLRLEEWYKDGHSLNNEFTLVKVYSDF